MFDQVATLQAILQAAAPAPAGIDPTLVAAVVVSLWGMLSTVSVAYYRHLIRIIAAHESREVEYLATIRMYEVNAPQLIRIADNANKVVSTVAQSRPAPTRIRSRVRRGTGI